MSLVDEIRAAVDELGNTYPGDYLYDIEDAEVVKSYYEGSHGWANELVAIIQRGDEYAKVMVMEPATEDQEWGQYDASDVIVVSVIPLTTIKYVEVLPRK